MRGIIEIEGMDGVGKTTISERLAALTGFETVNHPLQHLINLPNGFELLVHIEKNVCRSDNKVFTSWFYGLSNIFLCEYFKDKNIIIDRHLLSNFCWSGSAENEFVYDAIHRAIGAPQYTVLLYASPEKTIERMKKRDLNDKDLKKVSHIDIGFAKMRYIMAKYNMPGVIIDTSDLEIDEVVDQIYAGLVSKGIIKE